MSDARAWVPTHWVPASGLEARATPDAAAPPAARLDPWLEVSVAQTWGDWAQVVCANGWWGWVDGRGLVPRAPATAREPAAPTAVAPGPGGAAALGDRARAGWIALVGAAAIALSTVLPWLTLGGQSADAFDVPVEFLLSYDSRTDLGVDLGPVLLLLALAGAAAVLWAPSDWWRRGIGIGVAVLALLYVVQVQRSLSAGPASGRPGLLSTVGFAVYVVLAGAGALAVGPFRAPSGQVPRQAET